MLHQAQQLGIDSRQPCQCARIQAIISSPALGDQANLLGVPHDHFVPQRGQQPAHSGRMRPRLHGDETPRQATEHLLHGFRCGRQFMLQNDFSCFIQNAVRTKAISQIQPNGQLPFENVFSTRLHSATSLFLRLKFVALKADIGSLKANISLKILFHRRCEILLVVAKA
jgi:hypothetical protein